MSAILDYSSGEEVADARLRRAWNFSPPFDFAQGRLRHRGTEENKKDITNKSFVSSA